MNPAQWFGVNEDYVRPRPAIERRDIISAVALGAVVLLIFELMHSMQAFGSEPINLPAAYAVTTVMALTTTFARRHPLIVMVLITVIFATAFVVATEVFVTAGFQLLYLYALYTTVAWARDRQMLLLLVSIVVAVFMLWVTWDLVAASGLDRFLDTIDADEQVGWFSPVLSYVTFAYLINTLYLAFAVVLGTSSWWQARHRHHLAEQAQTISDQSQNLRDQALVNERLRIARELHDAVGHRLAVIGIHAGAARAQADRDPQARDLALANVEESARLAVSEMRDLLGALRLEGSEESRGPEPGFAQLPSLFDSFEESGLTVEVSIVGDTASVPTAIQASLYRITQESLANVLHHSTADDVRLALRVPDTRTYVELEIVDGGRARPDSGGSGMGHIGIRERVRSHGGTAEIGPRLTGGYRVRARIPLEMQGSS